ncbi:MULTISPECIES: LacI family DNA-binding transcriptional regulator [unclassified Cryobacterium]|uniref:LacI family DNA-binding transcriptional regulator n=1 Tax=unclassified Cryobacterium TaxID=2649013 RepID=UPI002AB5A092|nr:MULTISPECIES: LacI family DNA-binding transcriptional regulator [unclassified Cryobacterium]MDY7544452.1 LacI family DNA-binding transcriptional regulator [Cryobacterium sp. 5B3]MEB0000304.1 LacI family DNA-binding transcriptional regulator [Cryobacterium sp. RTS3]MEB0267374.1 LacI family DNA-binding transcriptional regulator [Cryobacterium sp. 10I5]MEB0276308.1 LacI family DNA-binding transcriptional regulator [Cryobacterium sp. 5B3]
MPATLKDVADHAKVSMRTVSNVVSGYEHVSKKMRERVMTAIADLDYRPNLVARTLRTGRTGMLALVVPEIDVPYFSELARDVIRAATSFGYRVMIDQTGHDHERERDLLVGGDRNMLFDGILFSPLATKAQLDAVEDRVTLPFVLLGEHEFDGRFDHVAIDNFKAAQEATMHLLAIGRSRIAAIGEQPFESYATPHLRTAGYLAALDSAGIASDADLIKPAVHYRRADGYAATQQLLKLPDRPDAIFCYSDILAMGAMRAVFDAGLIVPKDIAIIGIDDIEEGQYSRPTLSTVSLDTEFIAHHAVATLAARIDDPERTAEEVVAPHSLKVRESSA